MYVKQLQLNNKSRGTTIVEVLLYAVIVGILVASYFMFFSNLFSFFNKKEAQREVLSEGNFLMTQVGQYIENSKAILEPATTDSYILLDAYNVSEAPTKIYINNTDLLIKLGANPARIINSNRILVTAFSVAVLKNNGIASSVNVKLTVAFNNLSGRQELNFNSSLASTFTLKGK